ncbi:DUF3817 domain-containing protein [Flectobacillus major]|jgi:integral membrane protein|uniref:DUF3817 domain-containing protein n=1 Tax=Flectobacillus major TaxID=103 RepID=UPI0009DC1FDB|nr:DUF3817 domain-containing protein [Flectobacillus major]
MSESHTLVQKLTKYYLLIGKTEGYSYLLLLFVAMPAKYLLQKPELVRIAGSIHGFLFVAFVGIILLMILKAGMSIKNAILAFLLSLIPFGTFYLRKTL